ncbi:IS1634 family transposase [Methanogenium marinum]|uniref:IS1634 family transposase n=1 Tax=Methanogenium marinum TaxID=348610 RepID=A0A9Q4PWE8_9EURY|nr:IS1634 family transposase [Methanogenium marinum]MDE4907286.1 IS1634 family transposase [Methanogenium marinum]
MLSAKKSLRKIGAIESKCEPDAHNVAQRWLSDHPLFWFSEYKIITIQGRAEKKRGRPKTGELMVPIFRFEADIEFNEEAVEKERQKLSRFILATYDTAISADELLYNYKEQGTVERGFQFLKDKSFLVAEVYLKKPSRIQALSMIMVLCLFIYSMTEFRLRKELEKSGKTVTSQTKRHTQRPTMKWIFFRFRRVREF